VLGLGATPTRLSAPKDALRGARCGCRRARGFTLLDVLVTLAVMVVLISIMLPSLGRVRETAHQVICRSNVRQIGIGISQFTEHNQGRLMPSVNAVYDGTGKPWDTNLLRLDPHVSNIPGRWDGLGHLYDQDYMPAPKIFYCPSHRGRNAYLDYQDQWGAQSIRAIAGNYQYRGQGPTTPPRPGHVQTMTATLHSIYPRSAIASDSLRDQLDFNHQIGANILRADNSVDWYSDSNGRILTLLPREGENPQPVNFENVWRNLDEGG
jgi:type II secretory pathway pseudopilin PulG